MGSIPLSLSALAQKAAHAEPVKPNLGLQSFDLLPSRLIMSLGQGDDFDVYAGRSKSNGPDGSQANP